MLSSGTVRHHFDLSHLNGPMDDLKFHVGLEKFPVNCHDSDSLAEAISHNSVIGMMAAEQVSSRITHYADAPASAFPARRIRRLQVSYDNGDSRFRLRPIAWIATYIPAAFRHKARIKALRGDNTIHPAKLRDLGLAPVAAARHAELMADADLIGMVHDTAVHLVMKHPQLGTTFVPSAARIETHVNAGDNQTAMFQLAFHIHQNPTTWQAIEVPVDPTTQQPYVFEYPLGPHKAGDPVEQYALSDDTVSAMGAAMIAPLNTTNDDLQLRNQSWSVAHGRPTVHGAANRALRRAARRKLGASDVTWNLSLRDLPQSWGLSIDPDSISYDGTSLSIDVTNSIQRTVGVYVEFLDPSGNAIVPPNWSSKLGPDLQNLETDTIKYLRPILPETVVMGMALSNTTATVSFPWPEAASSARLTFGSMGGSNWNAPYSVAGAVLTGVFNFGFPALFLSAGVFSAGGTWFDEIVQTPEGMIVITLGAAIIIALIIGGNELGDVDQVLTTFGGIVAGMLVKKALISVMGKIAQTMSGDEVADSVPFVGQFLRAAAAIGYATQLIEAGIEVFSAPAVMSVEINRAFTVKVGVSPDPRHGLPGKPSTAVWPALGDTYEVTVRYRGGVSWVQTGSMPASESGTPLALAFDGMPAGGSLQVVVAIKSSDGWLAGTWTSDWHDALPSDGDLLTGVGSLAVNGSITEQLAPLTAATTYGFNQSIVYSPTGGPKGTGGHAWVSDTAPTATAQDLGSGADVGLGELVSMSVLEKTYSVGYVWKGYPLNPNADSSGAPAGAQAYCYQGLSLIGDPDSQLVTPNSVTAEQSGVFYEKLGPAPQAGGPQPYNFLVDPSSGTLNLTAIDLSGSPSTISLQPPAPTWGGFPLLKTLDDAVVHPGGDVVGISSATDKLLVLTLPKTGAVTATGSMLAQICSATGTRQGLIDTPVALDICPDGRILVLEQGNARVQAFDTRANPVPSFTGALLLSADGGGITADLDDETLPAALQALFLANRINLLFSLPASIAGDLVAGTAAATLLDAFHDEGTLLSEAAVVAAGATTGQWTIVDPTTKQSYGVVSDATSGGFDVFHIFGADATVTARVTGSRWTISDPAGALAYDIRISGSDPTKIDVHEFLSTFPLAATTDGTAATCLDIAVEATGFVYVLTHINNGYQVSDFALDIYTAEGNFLSRTASAPGATGGFVGANITLDIWRNLFTLDFQKTVGLNGQSEPTISQWVPTVPAGTLPAANSADFMSGNLAKIRADLDAGGVPLAASFSIKQISAAGRWHLIGPPSYDVILSAGTKQPVGGSTATGELQLYLYPLANA
jgi:hypothetical protein